MQGYPASMNPNPNTPIAVRARNDFEIFRSLFTLAVLLNLVPLCQRCCPKLPLTFGRRKRRTTEAEDNTKTPSSNYHHILLLSTIYN
ncbi:hypothetical protein Ahy_B01g055151 isoform B [Arachis hypogaea]|uniref:Uncharacterized protein n=1 Tax=Arachis hypogaea TaxID=3818 RepID=A0A445AVG3_ARAHY|nr:hypothetical protein Ahy_B01g055151 isoform B [Arachis hypogaea]